MLLLHLSDLHFGPHSRFVGEDLVRLGKAFQLDLEEAKKHCEIKGKVDLVVVTGDVAEAGKPKEFEMGTQFLTALAGELGLEHRRFAFVPGNHDISWPACKKVEADQEEDGFDEDELRRRMDAVKLGRYEEFLRKFYGVEDLGEVALPLNRGAYLYSFPDLRLSVGALNSCERESHRKKDHLGSLSRQQAEALMGVWLNTNRSAWLKVVAVHHNPVVTVSANLASWRDYLRKTGALDDDLIARYEADVVGLDGREHLRAIVTDAQVQLVLHGHHHAKDEQPWLWKGGAIGCAHVLSAGSLSLNSDVLPQDEPLSFRLIELDPEGGKLRALSLVFDVRARTKGEVRWGAFLPDPAEPGGYLQRLDLPTGFVCETGKPLSKETGTSVAFLRTYRQAFGQAFARWDLSVGVVQSGGANRPIEAALDDMYQPLRLAAGFNTDKTLGAPIEKEVLLARSHPLAIRGPAGAGKTTWIRHTFRRLMRMESAVPLMLVVRDLARRWQEPDCKGAERALDTFLDAWAAERIGAGWEGELKRCLESETGPRPVLLVDGWDEAGRLGEELRENLLGFMERHPRMLVVVTSRPYGDARPSHSEGFEVLDVQPLSDAEIQQFARRFFLRCHGEDEAIAVQEAQRFWAALTRAPEPRALARTALLLTMMLLISRSEPIPDKRHLLYERCIDSLLTALPDRKAEQGALLLHEQWRPDDSEERKRVVATLAFALQDLGYRMRARSSIVGTWEEMTKLLPKDWPELKKSGFLAWLAGPAGILTDRADGTLVFSHLSFQEYLCAWQLHATIEGSEARSQFFLDRIPVSNWWETLRLWAALIERQSPERLEQVLELISSSQVEGLVFAGTILADGIGTDRRFAEWCRGFVNLFETSWPPRISLCSQAWAASRQDKRKTTFEEKLAKEDHSLGWRGWIRLGSFLEEACISQQVSLPNKLLHRSLIERLSGKQVANKVDVAAGRILCGGHALWPADPLDIGLLNIWPGDRRVIGTRLQSAILFGASLDDLKEILLWPPSQEGALGGDTIDLSGLSDWIGRDCAVDFARYLSRYFVKDAALRFASRFNSDATVFLPAHFDRDDRSYFDVSAARSYARAFFKEVLVEPNSGEVTPTWLKEFEEQELLAIGRSAARSALARSGVDEKDLNTWMLAEACRISLHPSRGLTTFDRLLSASAGSSTFDPLWSALARHLARCSTAEDRRLLIGLAQHPVRREPPLSWGLQFIVRGDVMLDDGSVVTLDELTDHAGLPRLPYLEELPDELQVDWWRE
jgi:3',5'-cyclic AMP phosphodiesterase CpdA